MRWQILPRGNRVGLELVQFGSLQLDAFASHTHSVTYGSANQRYSGSGADFFGQDSFTAMIGAEAIREMLKGMNLEKIAEELKIGIAESKTEKKVVEVSNEDFTKSFRK